MECRFTVSGTAAPGASANRGETAMHIIPSHARNLASDHAVLLNRAAVLHCLRWMGWAGARSWNLTQLLRWSDQSDPLKRRFIETRLIVISAIIIWSVWLALIKLFRIFLRRSLGGRSAHAFATAYPEHKQGFQCPMLPVLQRDAY